MRPGLWVFGILFKLFCARSFAFLPIHPSHSHPSPLYIIPTFDIMSSPINNARPSLYVSTTPIDQEGEVPVTWNMMRNNVNLILLEVSDVFQQSLLIVS